MDVDSQWGRLRTPLEYRVTPLFKLGLGIVGALMLAGSSLFLFFPSPPPGRAHDPYWWIINLGFGLSCAGMGVFALMYVIRGSLSIDKERVIYRWGLHARSMRREEVVGKSVTHTKAGRPIYWLVPEAGRRMIVDGGGLDVDSRYRAWIDAIPTLPRGSRGRG